MGINTSETKKVIITFKAATIPNSTNRAEPVKAKTPKPIEVVKLAKNNVLPTVEALSIKESSFDLPDRYVSWYLFNKKMTFGIPITTISGGINPDKSVILNPKKTMVAKEATIPTKTTILAKNTTLKDRKKNNKIRDVTKMAKPKNRLNSFVTWDVYSVRMKGIPVICTVCFILAWYCSPNALIFLTSVILLLSLITF